MTADHPEGSPLVSRLLRDLMRMMYRPSVTSSTQNSTDEREKVPSTGTFQEQLEPGSLSGFTTPGLDTRHKS